MWLVCHLQLARLFFYLVHLTKPKLCKSKLMRSRKSLLLPPLIRHFLIAFLICLHLWFPPKTSGSFSKHLDSWLLTFLSMAFSALDICWVIFFQSLLQHMHFSA